MPRADRTVRVRRSRDGRRGHYRHLYSNARDRKAEEAEFVRRYGKKGGRSGKGGLYIYGATVGKARRERQAARGRRGRAR